MERYALITARVLMSIMFLLDGLNMISQSLAVHEMAAHSVPALLIPTMIRAAQALQLAASIGLIFGIYPRLAALALILFLIPATLMAHAFWQAVGTPLYTIQLINFCKKCVYGWGTSFPRCHKRPTGSVFPFNALTNPHNSCAPCASDVRHPHFHPMEKSHASN
jgi:putative oxidoreductase